MEDAIIHKDSLRALAYEVLNQLYGAGPVDDSLITIYQIEAELRRQYGAMQEKEDNQNIRLGQRPDASRLVTTTVSLSAQPCTNCPPNYTLRTGHVGSYIHWNGLPYLTSVRCCELSIPPATSRFQLGSITRRNGRPAYVIEGNSIVVMLTPDTIGIDTLDLIGIPKDPFAGLGRDDEAIWERPWNISLAISSIIKERAEIRLRGGSVATWQRADKRNDGIETPVNNP